VLVGQPSCRECNCCAATRYIQAHSAMPPSDSASAKTAQNPPALPSLFHALLLHALLFMHCSTAGAPEPVARVDEESNRSHLTPLVMYPFLTLLWFCTQARQNLSASTARVWMKSAIVEREAGDTGAQRRLLEEGLRRFPTYWKLWMMLGQVRACVGSVVVVVCVGWGGGMWSKGATRKRHMCCKLWP
jgi:hypothetical protein